MCIALAHCYGMYVYHVYDGIPWHDDMILALRISKKAMYVVPDGGFGSNKRPPSAILPVESNVVRTTRAVNKEVKWYTVW